MRFIVRVFQAMFWTLFGPDSSSYERYFDHGHVPERAKEGKKWAKEGKKWAKRTFS